MNNHLKQGDLVWLATRTAKEKQQSLKIRAKIDKEVEEMLSKSKRDISNEEVDNFIEKRANEEYDKYKGSTEDLDKEVEICDHLSECFHCMDKYNKLIGK